MKTPAKQTDTTAEYLIWSNEHRAWWRPNSQGYTLLTHEAGRYSKLEAQGICRRANEHAREIEGVMVRAPVGRSAPDAFADAAHQHCFGQ